MTFISVFDVLGPIMVGPSSSHTAGTAAIAYLAQKMINGTLKKVEFTLYGSFARTAEGHGTKKALLGGVLGFSPEDTRIRDSFAHAKEQGVEFEFATNFDNSDVHPNTADMELTEDIRCASRALAKSFVSSLDQRLVVMIFSAGTQRE